MWGLKAFYNHSTIRTNGDCPEWLWIESCMRTAGMRAGIVCAHIVRDIEDVMDTRRIAPLRGNCFG